MSQGIDWLASVRGRIGYLVTPNALAYFTAGGALGQVNYAARAANEPPSTYITLASFSQTASGYVLGGGLEWKFAGNWLLRGEYLHYRLDSSASLLANDTTGNFPTFPSRYSWNSTNIPVGRVAVSYKF